jgi:hypothetical protein
MIVYQQINGKQLHRHSCGSSSGASCQVMQNYNLYTIHVYYLLFSSLTLIQQVAIANNLINDMGYPNTSGFVTYGYAAGPHVDNDDTITSGWVVQRPVQVGDFLFEGLVNASIC